MQIKTTTDSILYPSIRLEKFLNSDRAKCTLLVGRYIYFKKIKLWREILQYLIKLKIGILYHPPISIPGIYKNPTYVHEEVCTRMYTAVLVLMAYNWQQPSCASVSK